MNPEAQEHLKKILAKDIPELTEEDKAFMRARISYIGKTSRAKFAEVFNEKKVITKEDNRTKNVMETLKEESMDQSSEEEEEVIEEV